LRRISASTTKSSRPASSRTQSTAPTWSNRCYFASTSLHASVAHRASRSRRRQQRGRPGDSALDARLPASSASGAARRSRPEDEIRSRRTCWVFLTWTSRSVPVLAHPQRCRGHRRETANRTPEQRSARSLAFPRHHDDLPQPRSLRDERARLEPNAAATVRDLAAGYRYVTLDLQATGSVA
jgi:hypothetical protein